MGVASPPQAAPTTGSANATRAATKIRNVRLHAMISLKIDSSLLDNCPSHKRQTYAKAAQLGQIPRMPLCKTNFRILHFVLFGGHPAALEAQKAASGTRGGKSFVLVTAEPWVQ